MIVNTTFYIDTIVKCEFINWVRTYYLASAIPGKCKHHLFMRILTPMEEGESYAVQLQWDDPVEGDEWMENRQAPLLADLTSRFGEKALYFVTKMEEMES